MNMLDPRLNAFREDLADEKLKSKVEAAHWARPVLSHIKVPVASVHKRPDVQSMQLTQALRGEACHIFESSNGWVWVQLSRDGYVGYVLQASLLAQPHAATHTVANVSTRLFPKADLKAQPSSALYMNSEVCIARFDGNYAILQNGDAVFGGHLRTLGVHETDFVSVAEKFLHVPYYWGGKTCAGIDCSGLVQSALHACGISCPRDSDMQENAFGQNVGDKYLQRGDLVFWPGHVGIMQSATQLLHANGHFMMVTSEPLADVVARSDKLISSVRRVSANSLNTAAK